MNNRIVLVLPKELLPEGEVARSAGGVVGVGREFPG
ncbi:MAG: hypothetical protein RL367_2557 [Pseudomonadota bacterium]